MENTFLYLISKHFISFSLMFHYVYFEIEYLHTGGEKKSLLRFYENILCIDENPEIINLFAKEILVLTWVLIFHQNIYKIEWDETVWLINRICHVKHK